MGNNTIKHRKKKRFLNQEDKEKICKMYSDGIKCEEIGEIMNSDPSWIVKIAKRGGVWKDKSERMMDVGRTSIITEEMKDEMIKMSLLKMNYAEISDYFGLTYDVVSKFFRKNKIAGLSRSDSRRSFWLDENWLDEINSPEKAIYLGLFFADGCNNTSNKISNECYICLHKHNANYLSRLASFFTDKPLRKSRNTIRMQSVSKNWVKNLTNYGAVPAKSLILKWPTNISESMERYFIRGFFEGDGGFCCGKKKKTYYIVITSTKEFLEGLASILLKRLGIICGIGHVSKLGNNTYSLRISRIQDVKLFCDWIYSDNIHLAMERKYKIYQEFLNYRFPNGKIILYGKERG